MKHGRYIIPYDIGRLDTRLISCLTGLGSEAHRAGSSRPGKYLQAFPPQQPGITQRSTGKGGRKRNGHRFVENPRESKLRPSQAKWTMRYNPLPKRTDWRSIRLSQVWESIDKKVTSNLSCHLGMSVATNHSPNLSAGGSPLPCHFFFARRCVDDPLSSRG